MLTSNGYALLIGVDDYSAYDASVGLAKGTSDLPGGLNDVRAFWRICLDLGIQPENIRVLTSPALKPGELEGSKPVNFGPATESEILANVDWLAQKLGAEAKPSGLLAYTGHGDYAEAKGLVLCPTDVSGDDLDHAIPFSALQSKLTSAHAADNLTVVLDTCHSGTGQKPQKGGWQIASLRNRPIAIPPSIRAARDVPGGRVLTASSVEQSAYQARFSGVYRGAFSWAIGAVLEQWKLVQEGENVRVTISYQELRNRAEALLKSLSFPQTPQLQAAPEVEALSFFHQGLTAHADETSKEPDAQPVIQQLDPGFKGYNIYSMTYTAGLTVSTSKTLSARTTYNTGTVTFTADNEYWSMTSTFTGHVNSPASGATLQLNGSAGTQDWPHSGGVSGFPVSGALTMFKMPATIPSSSWVQTSNPPSGTFIQSTSTTDNAGIEFNLTAPVPPSTTWSGNITWYVLARNTPTGFVLAAGSNTTFTEGTAPTPATNYSWYKVVLTPSAP
jgi:hypothetical protein